MYRTSGILLLFCLLSGNASALSPTLVQLNFDQAGYMVIDGRYYVFDGPKPFGAPEKAELHARGNDGFFMRAQLATGACVHYRSDLQGLSVGLGGLRHAELLDAPDAAQLDLVGDSTEQAPQVSLTSCDNTLVLLANTAAFDTGCSMAIPFPFRRGQCPGLDRADRGHVFFSDFD